MEHQKFTHGQRERESFLCYYFFGRHDVQKLTLIAPLIPRHGVLHLPENDTPQKIQELDCLKYLLISNSVAIERELPKKIRKLSIAPLLAESVARSLHSESIRDMLNVKRAK